MASRISGITVEIGGDTTGLQTALSGVNSEIKSTETQLKDKVNWRSQERAPWGAWKNF